MGQVMGVEECFGLEWFGGGHVLVDLGDRVWAGITRQLITAVDACSEA